MDFARKQLEKYGWSDGKGLGKHENGISEALKPKLKRSVTGVGHNAASDFTEHWWTTLYNKAASNIEVKEKNGMTKKIKTKDGFEITNNTWKLKRKKSKPLDIKAQDQYEDFFIKTAVLGSGGSKTERVRQSESESGSEDDQVQTNVFKLSDEELFAACEGRTAHKGARHGLKALGKLARIEQQEKLLLQQSKFIGYTHANDCKKNNEYKQEIIEIASLNRPEGQVLKKKTKKKLCLKKENYDSKTKKDSCAMENDDTSRKINNCDIEKMCNEDKTDLESPQKKVKKKKPGSLEKKMQHVESKTKKTVDSESDVLNVNKKRKKRKHLDT